MAQSYFKRTKNLFNPDDEKPFKLSRSKIDMFLNCPRCFYLDRRLGVSQPSMPAFSLNIAVDTLLKKEFDIHRAKQSSHPLMDKYGIDAVPMEHESIDKWRENFVGIQHLHEKTNLLIFGAVDDVWINPKGELHVVDYKATSKDGEVELEDTKWHNQYRRQIEVYQWLLRKNGFPVSDTGYFVYVNGRKDKEAFDGKLEFDIKVIPYKGNDNWVEGAIGDIHECLISETMPDSGQDCEYCKYRAAARGVEKNL